MSAFALLLARDVTGLSEFANRLAQDFGYRLYGTAEVAKEIEGVEVLTVSESRELLEGAGDDEGIIVANYYSVETVGREFMSWQKAVAAFDSSLVALIRAAALKPNRLTVIGNPAEYGRVLELLNEGKGRLAQKFRMEQACNALHASSEFDASVAQYLEIQGGDVPDMGALSGYPKSIRFAWKRGVSLASGENDHQKAALYGTFSDHFEQLSGPVVDYGVIVDISAATYLIGEFEKTAVALVQKGSILGVACGGTLTENWDKLGEENVGWLRSGVCIVNATVGIEFAEVLAGLRGCTVIAPRFSDESLDVLKKNESLRLFVCKEGIGYEALQENRSAIGGALVQDKNRVSVNPMEWSIRSFVQPHVDQWDDMMFAVKISRHLRSSSCVAIQGERIVAQASACPVQMLAVSDVLRQLEAMGVKGAVLAVDETIEDGDVFAATKEQGVSIVVHAGSLDPSMHPELSEAANEVGIVLVATGRSHCKL